MFCRDTLHGLIGDIQEGIVTICCMNLLSQGLNSRFRLSFLQAYFGEEKKRLIMEQPVTLVAYIFYVILSNKVSNTFMTSFVSRCLYLQCSFIGIWIMIIVS